MPLPFRLRFAASLLFLLTPGLASAGEPLLLSVHGHLRGAGGGPVADGSYPMGFALYAEPEGGKAVYTELLLGVDVAAGVFALGLGQPKSGEPLKPELFTGGQARWLGVTVGKEAEMPRVPLREVPYAVAARNAALAADLACSGCVGPDDLADASIVGAKIAAGAVEAKHVLFTYAGSKEKGGAADKALLADKAALAEKAGIADAALQSEQAKLADQAKAAVTATSADEAKSSALALKLQCTGCVTAAMVAADFAAGLIAAKQLAKVAASGKFSDLEGGPDLSGYAALAKANAFAEAQTFGKGLASKGDIDFGGNQALLFRFQNADKEPVACSAKTAGLAWYNTATQALLVCNGTKYRVFAMAVGLGSEQNPGQSCQQILTSEGTAEDGLYWIKPLDKAYKVLCDMKTQGGGWTRFLTAPNDTSYVGLVGVPNSQEFVDNGTFLFSKTMLKAGNREVLFKETVAPWRLHMYDFKQHTNLVGEDFVGAITGDKPGTVAVWNWKTGQWQSNSAGGCNNNNHSQWNCTPPQGVRFHYSTRDWTGDGGSNLNAGWGWWTGYNSGYGDYSALVKNWDGQYNQTAHDIYVR